MDQTSTTDSMNKFTVTGVRGNLATCAPNNSVLIHSCNCVGVWGKGVALALSERFPEAFEVYKEHCAERSIEQLLGTCLLLWAQDDSANPRNQWIACLFTSTGYGSRKTKNHPAKSKPAVITKHTKNALRDLREKLEHYKYSTPSGDELCPNTNQLWACKFNSGFFGVEWSITEELIEEVFAGWDGEMKIVSPN